MSREWGNLSCAAARPSPCEERDCGRRGVGEGDGLCRMNPAASTRGVEGMFVDEVWVGE
jgi:hypothetical protein